MVRFRSPLRGFALVALTALAVSVGIAVPTAVPARAAGPALPGSRLEFGLASQPSDLGWMTGSGVPWKYRYQYLSAGVNTGSGWETWNSPSGAFAAYYMTASGSSGYIPVFTYYELLQSLPATGSTESDKDFNNLNNSSTMSAYYGNFKLLMTLAHTYGKQVVVHVEPDFWGYMQQRGSPSSLTASVASSGFADVAGLPDTVQGFAYALLRLRDLYAPNVTLAIHASMWATGSDLATATTSLNAVAIADATAAYLNSVGVASNPYGSTWDAVFHDVDDHDAGWWEAQGSFSQWYTHWWDPTNTALPNFARYLAWVTELHAQTGRQQVAWQVPVGNQYFLTMNNTCGHYQDTVAQYFLAHTSGLFNAGIVAVLFGAGNACQTTNTDARADGVTNNNGAPTTDTLGWCSACNTHTSSYSDDDGGYLRVFVGQYYANAPTPTPSPTPTPAPTPSPSPSPDSLGGVLASQPAAASWSSSHMDVFVQGTDSQMWHRSWSGTTWSPWEPMGGTLTSAPSAASWGANRIDVFVRGSDNQLWHRWFDGSWHGWEPLGGQLTGAPAVTAWGANRLDVFVEGTDQQLWHKWWDGQAWHGWEPLGGVLNADPGAGSTAINRIDVVVRGTDGQMWHKAWAGSAWTYWDPQGGALASGPGEASSAAGVLDALAIGAGGVLNRDSLSGSVWSGWQGYGGFWTSGPSAVSRASHQLDVFARGADAALWHQVIST